VSLATVALSRPQLIKGPDTPSQAAHVGSVATVLDLVPHRAVGGRRAYALGCVGTGRESDQTPNKGGQPVQRASAGFSNGTLMNRHRAPWRQKRAGVKKAGACQSRRHGGAAAPSPDTHAKAGSDMEAPSTNEPTRGARTQRLACSSPAHPDTEYPPRVARHHLRQRTINSVRCHPCSRPATKTPKSGAAAAGGGVLVDSQATP